MFIVGVSIPFAVANRLKKGETVRQVTLHAMKRSLLLLFFGWALYFVRNGQFVLKLQNVLAQLAFTYVAAFLIRNKSFKFQLIFTLTILLLIDLAYRYFPLEGFNHPWINHENLGAWFNNFLERSDKTSSYATLNFVSTTAHTVWGVSCGKLLMSDKSAQIKIQQMLIYGIAALMTGFGLDLLNITPIIKTIATSSFVLASGGWTILFLAFSYWLIDVKKLFLKGSRFFIVVGMNSIFIYLFFHTGGSNLISKFIDPFSRLLFAWGGELLVSYITSLGVWAALWYICFWLYRNKVFVKI
jgi:predicted acyltransferase